MSRRATPPAFLERLLRRCIPDGASGPSSLLGDLFEEYRAIAGRRGRAIADLWYLGQAVAIGVPFAVQSAMGLLSILLRGVGLDLRATLRAFRTSPGLLAIGVLSLILGTGLTTAALVLVNGVFFAPLPYPEVDRLVDVEDTHPVEVCRGCSPGTSWAAYQAWRAELSVFERLEATNIVRGRVQIGGLPTTLRFAAVTEGLPALLGLSMRLGRAFAPEDLDPTAPPVVILGHGLWVDAFGSDPEILGRTVEIDEVAHTVIGVQSETDRLMDRASGLLPLRAGDLPAGFEARDLWVVGRVADGVGLETADAALAAHASRMFDADPALERGWSATVTPLAEVLRRSAFEPSAGAVLLLLAGFVLLMASLNLAALLLARSTERGPEFAIRSSLGAGRLRLARAALMDAGLLATVGGVGGLLLVIVARDVAIARFSAELPGWVHFPLDLRVFAGVAGAVVLASTISGFLPVATSLAAGRAGPLSSRVRRDRGPRRLRAHDALLGLQIVLGIVLVAGSVGSLRSYLRASDFDSLGFRWEGLSVLHMRLPIGEGDARASAFFGAVARGLDDHPSVERHALVRSLFLGSWGTVDAASPVHLDGAPEPVSNADVPRHSLAIGPDYFDLREIEIVAGRAVLASDRRGGPAVAVVSEDAARTLWPAATPAEVIGRGFTIAHPSGGRWGDDSGAARTHFSVVGVAAAVVTNPSSESRRTTPRIYTALDQTPTALLDAAPLSSVIAQVEVRGESPTPREWADWLEGVAPEATLAQVATVEAGLRRWISPIVITGLVMSGLAALVLLLMVLGIYGTISYRISRGRRELGVRVALGAPAGAGARIAAGRVAVVAGLATLLGCGLTVLLAPLLTSAAIPRSTADPLVLLAVALIVAGVTAASSAGPVRRALRIDPAESLRAE